MEKKTVFFNSDQGANGRRTTTNGGIEIVQYGTGLTDLFIRGPKGGLRHVVMLPDLEALLLGQELVALCSQG
ncbi:MAG: hypothetical protein M1438_11070 [Deltaproteobacteria bacterium]|nr:hypothetical protein [Deltaproteobacteria bacterium]